MKDPLAFKELNSFSDGIAFEIIKCIRSESFKLTACDDWFIEELVSSRGLPVTLAAEVNQFFWLGFKTPKSLSILDAEVEEVTVTVAVFGPNETTKASVGADNCPLDGSPVGLHMNVYLEEAGCDDFICDEVYNAVRHELEHMIQDDFAQLVDYLDYHKILFALGDSPTHMCLYLTQQAEVSAHVRGYQAVTSNVLEFSKKTGDLLEGYVSQGHLTREEKSAVFWCWKDWYDRNNYNEQKESSLCAK